MSLTRFLRPAWLAIPVTLGLCVVSGPFLLQAERYHRQRVRQLSGIPCYDYQWGERSASAQDTASGFMLEQRVSEKVKQWLADKDTLALMARAAQAAQPLIAEVTPQGKLQNDSQVAPQANPLGNPQGNPQGAAPRFDIHNGMEVIHRPDELPPIASVAPVASNPPTTPPSVDLLTGVRSELEGMLQSSLRDLSAIQPERDLRFFQLDRAQLTVDHCVVSDVAIQLYRNGCWVLSLRADQHPNSAADAYVHQPRLHLKRNQFNVRLRCYGFYSGATAPSSLKAGRPILAQLKPVSFWVERQQPKFLRIGCFDHNLAVHFDRINRMEVEFFYR